MAPGVRSSAPSQTSSDSHHEWYCYRGLTTFKDPDSGVDYPIAGGIRIFTSSSYRVPYSSTRANWEENIREVGKGTQEVLLVTEAVDDNADSQAEWDGAGSLMWGQSLLTFWDIRQTDGDINWRMNSGTGTPNTTQQNWMAWSYFGNEDTYTDYLDIGHMPYNKRHIVFPLMNNDLLWLYPEDYETEGSTTIWPIGMTDMDEEHFYQAKHWNGGLMTGTDDVCPCLNFSSSDYDDGFDWEAKVDAVNVYLRGRWGVDSENYYSDETVCDDEEYDDYYCGGDGYWPPSEFTPAYEMNRADIDLIEEIADWSESTY